MIKPIRAMMTNQMMSNPISINPQKAYSDTRNYRPLGEKLNINCNENRLIVKQNGVGKNLDVMA